jgi:precorrin-2 methylase
MVNTGFGVTGTALFACLASSASPLVEREEAVEVLMATTHMRACGDELAIRSDTHTSLWRVARKSRAGGNEPISHQTQGQTVRTL